MRVDNAAFLLFALFFVAAAFFMAPHDSPTGFAAYPGFSNAKEIFLETTNPILNISPLKSFSIDFTKGIFYFMIPVTVLGKEDSIVIDNLHVRFGKDDRIIPVRRKLKLEKQK